MSVLGTSLVCCVVPCGTGMSGSQRFLCGSGLIACCVLLSKQLHCQRSEAIQEKLGRHLQGASLNSALGWPKNMGLSNYCSLREKVLSFYFSRNSQNYSWAAPSPHFVVGYLHGK